MNVKKMVTIAIFAALSIVLSFFKVFQMPNGGSITLYLVPLMFIALRYDFKSSLLCCFITAMVQLITSSYIIGFFQVLLDYILPVCAISLISVTRNRPVAIKTFTFLIVGLLMLSFYVISGIIYFKVNFVGSLIYNASFFVPTYIITIILISLLSKVKTNE